MLSARAKSAIVAGHSLAEVAFMSGFSDQSHLNRVFRRYMNITPAEYRKHNDMRECH